MERIKDSYEKTCVDCGDKFTSKGGAAKYCPICKEKRMYFNCEDCGKPTRKQRYDSNAHYCKACKNARHRTPRTNFKRTTKVSAEPVKKPYMSIDEVLLFAREKGISYGKAVQIYGK